MDFLRLGRAATLAIDATDPPKWQTVLLKHGLDPFLDGAFGFADGAHGRPFTSAAPMAVSR
jgi:hypothetical protein